MVPLRGHLPSHIPLTGEGKRKQKAQKKSPGPYNAFGYPGHPMIRTKGVTAQLVTPLHFRSTFFGSLLFFLVELPA
jgi:hypothetical protein